MAFKHILTAVTAAALIFSPTVAVAARGAAPAAAQVDPAAENLDENSELRRHGIIIPLAGIIVIILIVLLLTKKKKDPVSP